MFALVLYALAPRVVGTLFPGPGLLEGIPFSQVVQAADGTVLRVTLADEPPPEDAPIPAHWAALTDGEEALTAEQLFEQQQQQQQ